MSKTSTGRRCVSNVQIANHTTTRPKRIIHPAKNRHLIIDFIRHSKRTNRLCNEPWHGSRNLSKAKERSVSSWTKSNCVCRSERSFWTTLVSSGTFRESDFDLTNQVFIFVPRKLHGTVTELIFDGAVINNTGCPKFIAISRVRRRKTSRKKYEWPFFQTLLHV